MNNVFEFLDKVRSMSPMLQAMAIEGAARQVAPLVLREGLSPVIPISLAGREALLQDPELLAATVIFSKALVKAALRHVTGKVAEERPTPLE